MCCKRYMVQHQLLCHSLKDYREKICCPPGGVTTTCCFLCAQVTPLVHMAKIVFFAAIFYFHEACVVAKNISIQSRCLLDDIMHFYLDFTVYATPYLAHGSHLHAMEMDH